MLRRPAGPRIEPLESRLLPSTSQVLTLPSVALDSSQYDSSHLLVRFRSEHPVALPGTRLGTGFDLVPGLFEVELTGSLSLDEALLAYQASPQVLSAEMDYDLTSSWVPNDPRFNEQWHLNNTGQNGGLVNADIRAPLAWNTSTGMKKFAVAVLDSGIDYTHPDLYLNVWINQGEIPASRKANLIDIDKDGAITFRDLNDVRNQGQGKITDLNYNGYIDGGDLLVTLRKDALGKDTGLGGWADGTSQDGDSYVDDLVGWNSNANTNNPYDDYGHGSHVSGTIGAIGNNGIGVTGLNWQVSIVPVKFFDSKGKGTISQYIAGLDWALAKGIKISNNSWASPVLSQALLEAVKRAQARGHILVAAAGNDRRDTDVTPTFPAGIDLNNVVSVGATDRNDKLAAFSNWGVKSVDIAAPGVDILSTTAWKGYNVRSGTSMSSPQVAGALAMVWSLRPEWSYRQVIDWVLQTADRVPGLAGKVASGRLNLAAALRVPARAPASTQPPSAPTTQNPVANNPSDTVVTVTEATAYRGGLPLQANPEPDAPARPSAYLGESVLPPVPGFLDAAFEFFGAVSATRKDRKGISFDPPL